MNHMPMLQSKVRGCILEVKEVLVQLQFEVKRFFFGKS